MKSACKGTVGTGPAVDPDAPAAHEFGNSLDGDIRAAIRQQRAARYGYDRPAPQGLDTASEVRRAVRLQRLGERI